MWFILFFIHLFFFPPCEQSEKENRSHSSMLSCGVGSKVSPGAVTQVPQELLKNIAAGAIEKLQVMLEEQSPEKWLAERAECQQEKEIEKEAEIFDQEVTLDIWDFAGQAVYYTTHQVTPTLFLFFESYKNWFVIVYCTVLVNIHYAFKKNFVLQIIFMFAISY